MSERISEITTDAMVDPLSVEAKNHFMNNLKSLGGMLERGELHWWQFVMEVSQRVQARYSAENTHFKHLG